MLLRPSRLPLLAKILLSTSVAVTILFAITGQIVLRNFRRTLSDSLEEEVRNSFQAYNSLLNSRKDLLSSVSKLLSTMNEVRLAFSTGDRATIQDTASELWSKVSRSNAIFLVTDPHGKVLASLGGSGPLAVEKNLDVVTMAAAEFPKQSSGFFLQESGLYHISITPVYVDSTPEPVVLNVLVAGYHLDALVAQELKEATHSEFLFLTPGRVIASTLNDRATAAVVAKIARSRGAGRVTDGVTEYALFKTPLFDLSDRPVGDICILRSFEAAQKRVAGLYSNIILVWLGAMSVGFFLTYLLARRIVEPVKKLDRAAAEVARQNYAIEVE